MCASWAASPQTGSWNMIYAPRFIWLGVSKCRWKIGKDVFYISDEFLNVHFMIYKSWFALGDFKNEFTISMRVTYILKCL
jgi:hypothetical protein